MINGSLWSKEVREYRRLFCVCLLFAIVTGILVPLFYDRVIELPGGYIIWNGITASTLTGNSWANFTSVFLLQFSTLTAVLFGFTTFSGEISAGTIGYLFSKPLSRRETVTTKIIAGLTLLAFFVYGISFLFLMFYSRSGYETESTVFFLSTTVTFIITAVIYTATVFFSTLFTSNILSGVFSCILWSFVFFTGFFTSEKFSFFNNMKTAGYWSAQDMLFIPIGVGIVLLGLFYELTAFSWERREF